MTEYDYSPEGAAQYQQKMDGICRWNHETRQYRPADPFAPTTPALRVRALLDGREVDRDGWKSERGGGHGNRKHRSRSMGERESRSTHSRSHSYAQPPVIPGLLPQPQMHGQSSYSYESSYRDYRAQPTRSTTLPLPPPVPPVPTRSPPVRSHTTQGYNVYYPPQMPIPQGGVTFLPPVARPQFIQSPFPSPGYSPRRESKSWLSKLGSIFSSRSPSPPPLVYVQKYESSPKPKRSKSSKSKGKRRRSERSERRSERRYSY